MYKNAFSASQRMWSGTASEAMPRDTNARNTNVALARSASSSDYELYRWQTDTETACRKIRSGGHLLDNQQNGVRSINYEH